MHIYIDTVYKSSIQFIYIHTYFVQPDLGSEAKSHFPLSVFSMTIAQQKPGWQVNDVGKKTGGVYVPDLLEIIASRRWKNL